MDSATHDASPANSRVRAIKRVELFGLGNGAVRTLQQGCRCATGELQTRICVGVAIKVAYLSGQCCCTRRGLAALYASGSAFFLQSETVVILTCTCWWDGGKTALWNFDGGAVVPHTRVSFSHTMRAPLLRSCPRYQHRRQYAPHPPSRRVPDQRQPAAHTGEKSHLVYLNERDTGKHSVIHVAGNVAQSARHCARVAAQSPIAIRRD